MDEQIPARVAVTVGSRHGLHARPAARVVEAARALEHPVKLGRPDGALINPKSLAMLLALDANFGDALIVESECADSAQSLADLIAQELDREEPA